MALRSLDRRAFRRLALRQLDLLYATALRVTGSRELSEELVQETYRIAFERWRTLRDPAAGRAWLLRILRNLHMDELRRRRRLVPLEGEALEIPDPRSAVDPERGAAARLTLAEVERAVARLPEEARWLFVLREVEGLSYAELAEALEVPVGTVRSRLARLRARLVAAAGDERAGRMRASGSQAGGGDDAE